MSNHRSRRHFIKLAAGAGLAVVSASILQCKSSGKKSKNESNKTVARVSKKRKPPIYSGLVQNRGWYINSKNNKIHFFDQRGFTPSLKYFKNKEEFDKFTQHLQPYNVQQLTPAVFYSQVSKKNKDWITEWAALAFLSMSKFTEGFTILQDRIQKKKKINYRLLDLAGIVAIRSNDGNMLQQFQQLANNYNNSSDKKVTDRITKYGTENWQARIREKKHSWNGQTI